MNQSHVASELRAIFDGLTVAGLSDGQLLERFTSRRPEEAEPAFAALVARHGPMVFSVCHGSLGNTHDAEDAFQATFVVLARKAGSLWKPELLGPWLHGVARHTARGSRRKTRDEGATRRRRRCPAKYLDRTLNKTSEQLRSQTRSTSSTRRSSDCPSGTGWQSSSATWKASRMRRPRGGWADPSARSARGYHAAGSGCAAA